MAKWINSMVVFIVLACIVGLIGSVTGSINACPAPTPCLCDGAVIECEAHNLPHLSQFSFVPGNFPILKFGLNRVTTIPVAAFSILNVTEIHLNFNNISYIDPGAFRGLENILKVLNLAHNQLISLPGVIGTLSKLSYLDVSHNPMDGYRIEGLHSHKDDFTDSVMTALGDSLTKFTFGEDFLFHWPKSLHHLVQLQELNVAGSSIDMLYHGIFHGFEHTLRKLSITHSSFYQIPLDIGVFTQLVELHFDYNRIQDGDSVILSQPLIAINKTLKVLSLRYDNLKVVPVVLKNLGMLQNISLDGNPFEFISQEAVSFLQHTRVRILSFRDCGLKRIPGSMSDLTNLLELDFSHNLLKTIESVDLRNIPTLQTLILAYNPLKYISRDSFNGLRSLSLLDMSYSDITVIPNSIANLDSLQILKFLHSNIDCTCDLSWVLRLMEYISITFEGQCETIDQSIQDYVKNRVPMCPDYISYKTG